MNLLRIRLPSYPAREGLVHAGDVPSRVRCPVCQNVQPLSAASDVYCLGIVLYELLCSHRPYHLQADLTKIGLWMPTNDLAGQQQAVENPLGKRTTTTYDAAGQPTEFKDPLGNVTTTVYDAAGQVTATVNPLGKRTSLHRSQAPAWERTDPRLCLVFQYSQTGPATPTALGTPMTRTRYRIFETE